MHSRGSSSIHCHSNADPCGTSQQPAWRADSKDKSKSRVFWELLIVAAGAGTAALILFLFNPTQYGFYPVCFFHQMTGWNCPGCGGLRAAHALLHGHWRAAFAYNPLAILMLPFGAWIGLFYCIQLVNGRRLTNPCTRPAFLWAFGGLLLAFGICRNLPLFTGTWVAF